MARSWSWAIASAAPQRLNWRAPEKQAAFQAMRAYTAPHDSGGPSLSFRHAADLIAHGAGDTSVTMDDVAASRELEKAGVEYEIQVYSAVPHGFTEWESDRYESWDAFADFLAATRQD
jgi:acetyl esterase/lipase